MRFSLFFLSLLFPAMALCQWSVEPDFPAEPRLGQMNFTLNGKLFIFGGTQLTDSGYEAYNDLWSFDPQTSIWTEEASKPGSGIFGGFVFVIDNTAYIGLGANQAGGYVSTCWSFSEANGWSTIASMPAAGRVYPFSYSTSEFGLVGCGFSGAYLNDHWKYDPQNDQWTAVQDYPGNGNVGLVAFGIGTTGYVGMGDDGANFTADFYAYNPANDSWTAKSSFPGTNRSFAGCFADDTAGFILGGEGVSGGYTNEMWTYDPVLDDWQNTYDFNFANRRYGSFALIDRTFYYGLGQTGPNDDDVADDLWSYEIPAPVTAVADPFLTKRLTAFPNPFTDQLNIEISDYSQSLNSEIEVINSSGVSYYQGKATEVNTTQWPAQIYHVVVKTDSGDKALKVVKLR